MVTWLWYQNNRFLYVDYQSLTGRDLVAAIIHAREFVLNSGESEIYEIINFEGAIHTMEAFEELLRNNQVIKGLIAKSALLGISPVKQTFLKAFLKATNREHNISAFKTKTDALNWLFYQ